MTVDFYGFVIFSMVRSEKLIYSEKLEMHIYQKQMGRNSCPQVNLVVMCEIPQGRERIKCVLFSFHIPNTFRFNIDVQF